MRNFFRMNPFKRLICFVLILTFVLSSASGLSMMSRAEGEADLSIPTVETLGWDALNGSTNFTMVNQSSGGVRITAPDNSPYSDGISTKAGAARYKLSKGFRMEFTDFESEDNDYSVAVMLGYKSNGYMQYNCPGYAFIYSQDGDFAIVKTGSSFPNHEADITFTTGLTKLSEIDTMSIYVKCITNSDETVDWKVIVNNGEFEYTIKDVKGTNGSFTGGNKWYADSCNLGLLIYNEFTPTAEKALNGLKYYGRRPKAASFTLSKCYITDSTGLHGANTTLDKWFSMPYTPVESVTLDKAAVSVLESRNVTLAATVNPTGATDGAITWSSSDGSIATVDQSGKVTGVAIGQATITATTAYGKSATCIVDVHNQYATASSIPTIETLGWGAVNGTGISLQNIDNVGVRFSAATNTPYTDGIATQASAARYKLSNGFRLEFNDFESTDDNYSVAVMLGLDSRTNGKMTYQRPGYAFIYGHDGSFAIVKTVNNGTLAANSKVDIAFTTGLSKLSEADTKSLFVKSVKNDDGSYDWRVIVNNGAYEYTIEDVGGIEGAFNGNSWASDSCHLNISIFSDFTATEENALTGLTAMGRRANATSFTLSKCYYSDGTGVNNNTTLSKNFSIPYIPVESISLMDVTPSDTTDGSVTLKAEVNPANATEGALTWSSSDETVAKVDENGKVTGVQAGTATITAATVYGKKATFDLTIQEDLSVFADPYAVKGNPPEALGVSMQDAFTFQVQQDTNYLEVVHTAVAKAHARIYNREALSTVGDGITYNVCNIGPKDSNTVPYTFVVTLGTKMNSWYNTKGIMILYSSDGNFAIVAPSGESTDQNPNKSEVLYAKKLSSFDSSFAMNIKQESEHYLLTINGVKYTIPSEYLNSASDIYLSCGIKSGFTLDVDNKDVNDMMFYQDKNLWPGSNGTRPVYVFQIQKLESAGKATYPEGTTETAPDGWLSEYAVGMKFLATDKGTLVTHTGDTKATSRIVTENSYMLGNSGVSLKIKDLKSFTKNYSLAVGLYTQKAYWYDRQGVMLLYSRNGNFAVVATGVADGDGNGKNPNEAVVIASDTFENYSDDFTMNIKLSGLDYLLTVNGRQYVIRSEYLMNSETIHVGLGIVSAFDLSDGDVSGLTYFGNSFKSSDVTFTLESLSGVIGDNGNDSRIPNQKVDPETVGMKVNGDIQLNETTSGVRLYHLSKAAGWNRAYYTQPFKAYGDGMSLELNHIEATTNNYSIVVMLGGKQNSWYDQRGYMIIYGKSGNFSIVATDPTIKSVAKSPVMVSEVREVLDKKLSLAVKIQGKNYVITVNGKTYSVPVSHPDYPLENGNAVYVHLGVMGDGTAQELDYWSNKFKNSYVAYTITKKTGMVKEGETFNMGKDFGLWATGNGWMLEKTNKGTAVTQYKESAGWERLSIDKPLKTSDGGIFIELTDIQAKDSNYSFAIMLANEHDPWYDCTGYMIIYGKSGNFAIVATDDGIINPNKSAVVVSEQREALGKTLTINIKLVNSDYKVTVNGKEYRFPAEHEDYPLHDTGSLYVGFGSFNDAEIGKLVCDKAARTSDLSYVIKGIYHSDAGGEDEPIETVEKEKEDKKEEEEEKSTEVVEEPNRFTPALVMTIGSIVFILIILGVVIVQKKKKASRIVVKEEKDENK